MKIREVMLDTGCQCIRDGDVSQWIVPGAGLYVLKEHSDGRATLYSIEATGTVEHLEDHMRRVTGTKKRNAA